MRISLFFLSLLILSKSLFALSLSSNDKEKRLYSWEFLKSKIKNNEIHFELKDRLPADILDPELKIITKKGKSLLINIQKVSPKYIYFVFENKSRKLRLKDLSEKYEILFDTLTRRMPTNTKAYQYDFGFCPKEDDSELLSKYLNSSSM
jgi:hypothetical protein